MKGLLSAEANPTKLFYTLEQIYIFWNIKIVPILILG